MVFDINVWVLSYNRLSLAWTGFEIVIAVESSQYQQPRPGLYKRNVDVDAVLHVL